MQSVIPQAKSIPLLIQFSVWRPSCPSPETLHGTSSRFILSQVLLIIFLKSTHVTQPEMTSKHYF